MSKEKVIQKTKLRNDTDVASAEVFKIAKSNK